MHRLRIFVSRLLGSFGRLRGSRREADLDAELRAHIEALVEANVKQGMSPADARTAARREFGGVEQTKEAYRDQRGVPFLDALTLDFRFAFRMLAKNPAFMLVAILTLALGIGATTAVFSVVDRLLFRSLPYAQDDRLVSFGLTAPIEKNEFVLGAGYVDFRHNPGPFVRVAAMQPGVAKCDVTEQNPTRINCAHVEQSFLPTLGVEPILGRNFTPEEDRPKADATMILTYALWKNRYGGDPNVIGKTISLDGKQTRIIGILPVNFEMPMLNPIDALMPLALDEDEQRRSNSGVPLRTFARMKPGSTIAESIVGLQPFFEAALQGAPAPFRKEIHLSIVSIRDRQARDARLASWVLLGSVFAVLLVACTNVASLLLARATGRQRELAVRAALGASRGRLFRQGLVESLTLGILGGAAGCWVAHLLLKVFVSIAPEGIPRLQQASLDLRVVIFTFTIALFSAVLFGVAPALASPQPEQLCGKEIRATTRSVLRQILIAAQVAVSLILLTFAGLLLRSLWNLERSPTGMSTENVLTETVALAAYRYPQLTQQIAFLTALKTRLRNIPGVTSVAISDSLPPAGQMRSTLLTAVEPEGRPPMPEGTGGPVAWRAVSPEFFSILSVPIVRGRAFEAQDEPPSEHPMILDETLARRLFPNEDPIGKRIRLFRQEAPWRTVVGVAADVRNNGVIEGSDPQFYLPWENDPVEFLSNAQILVRTPLDANAVATWMREATKEQDATLPVTIERMSTRVEKLAERPRFNAVLLSLFAAMGVALAAIGIYGVVGFLVARQTQEIGVRMALGASPQNILGMVLWNIGRWTIVGAAAGLLGAWFCARLMSSLLFEVGAHDPLPLAIAVLLLFAVAFLAAYIPARRATQIDPLIALRYE
jgi:putative ABC transport system permease protein